MPDRERFRLACATVVSLFDLKRSTMKASNIFLPLSLFIFMGCSSQPANEQAAEATPQEETADASADQLPKGSPAATAQYDKDGLLIQVAGEGVVRGVALANDKNG